MMVTTVLSAQRDNDYFDAIRKKWVILTPEEKVRQKLIIELTSSLSYPKELLVIEKSLSELPHLKTETKLPKRRVDLLFYTKGVDGVLLPLLLIECKQSQADQKALDQVMGYNHHIKALFVAVVAQSGVIFGASFLKNTYAAIPPYPMLIAHAKSILGA